MKHKFLTLALSAAFASTMLFSCSNAEEPNIPAIAESDNGEMIEYTLTVNVPDEMRTRDISSGSIGESGLFEHTNRTINNLWYVAYYDNEYVTRGTVSRIDENPFVVNLRLTNASDPTKLYLFFWAGNSKDFITFGSTSYVDDYVIMYETKTVKYKATSYNEKAFEFTDSFAGYFQFSEVPTNMLTKTFTLKRPFAEFHILTDEFVESELADYYSNGSNTMVGFSSQPVKVSNQRNYENLNICTSWDFSNDNYTYDMIVTTNNFADKFYFYNPLTGESPFRTTFKERQMDYLDYFVMLAPTKKKPLANVGNATMKYLNFIVSKDKKNLSSTDNDYVSIELPEDGIQANYKYVIYNKERSKGGTGFLTP